MKDDDEREDSSPKDENGHDKHHRSILCITNTA